MTIFDTLRFPNIDIYDKEELDKLPRDLLEEWAAECIKDTDSVYQVDVKDPQNDFSIIAFNAAHTKISSQCYLSATTKIVLSEMFKRQFTKDLKRRLAEYDQEA